MDDSDGKKTCFIITPIGNETDPIRRHVDGVIDAAIIPVLEPDYEVKVAHRLPNPGSINKQVVQLVYESDLVIANLTGKNPNVMYELAFRHCVGTPTIMIAEKGTELPFDVATERTIFYINDSEGVIELREDLQKCINSLRHDEFRQNNPIYDNLASIIHDAEIVKKVADDAQEDSGVLKYILSRLDVLQDSMQRIVSTRPMALPLTLRLRAECRMELIPEDVGAHSRIVKGLIDSFKVFAFELRQASFPGKDVILIDFFAPDNLSRPRIVQNIKAIFDSLHLKVKDICLSPKED